MTETTSVSMPDELYEYAKRNNISFSAVVQEGIKNRMNGDSEHERLKHELQEKKKALEELDDKRDRLEAQINALSRRLEELEEGKTRPIDELIDTLSNTKERLDYDEWSRRAEHIADETRVEITPEQLVACLDYVVDLKEDDGKYAPKEAPNKPFTDEEREKARSFIEEEV